MNSDLHVKVAYLSNFFFPHPFIIGYNKIHFGKYTHYLISRIEEIRRAWLCSSLPSALFLLFALAFFKD
ncbi:hypothetical protein A359_03370 [secondary endosymbiont of Ctenarytaina eucalypti]|uniref:Uncharacterized protein n=1 Tax=secondary endosymbiont of Ctenarytaina eucalypti TaxID=1199245 RepID=J3TF65_9ENTR|nr:hypothetical protein A359_03370 [secondary endosymbiont of Ctenarytaina eucalypti]